MNLRLLATLPLLFALAVVSWGMRVHAQSGTLEERVAKLEAQVADLQARSLPAPDSNSQLAGFVVMTSANSFQMICTGYEYGRGTGQVALTCMRQQPSVSTNVQPT